MTDTPANAPGDDSLRQFAPTIIRRMIADGVRDAPFDFTPVMDDLGAIFLGGEPGQVRFRFLAPERGRQGDGLIHGGVIATMLDCAMSFAAMSVLEDGETIASINLNISFLRPGSATFCEAEGLVENAGRRVIFTRATIRSGEGKSLATATSSFARIARRPPPR